MKWKKIIVITLCTLTISAASILTIWDFSLQLQNALTRETYNTLSNVSLDYNKAFLDRISCNTRTMGVLAESLKEMPQLKRENMMHILQTVVNYDIFAEIIVCDLYGIGCNNEGEYIDISSQAYFKKALENTSNVTSPLVSYIDGEENIVISVPISDEETTQGLIFGLLPLSKAGERLLDFTYYSNGYGFIVTPNGDIVLSSEHADKLSQEKNLFSFFKKTDLVDLSLEEIKAAIKNGESKNFSFIYNGQKRFVSCTPSTVNDWYTFSLSSDGLMQQQKKTTNRIVSNLVIKLLLAALLTFEWITFRNKRHNKEILKVSQKYQSLLSHINGGMIVAIHASTADETIATYVSTGFTDMTGYTLSDIQTEHKGRYLDIIFHEDRKEAFKKYLEQVSEGNTYRMPYRIQKKDGSTIWVMDNGYLVDDENGSYNHSIITDISLLKQQEEELRMSESRFSIAINASSGTLFELDLKKQLYSHFENAERIFGVDSQKLLDDTAIFSSLPHNQFVDAVANYFFHPDDCQQAKSAMGELLKTSVASYEARLRRYDDVYIWCKVDLRLCLDEYGSPARLIGFMSDIDDVKKRAELLESKIQTDPMTGVYNKIAMAALANKVLLDNPLGRHALMILDIDNFKGINDTLGHAFGDLVIIEVSTKLKASFRINDIVGRIGGDEFAVLLQNVSDTSNVLKKAAALSAAFRQTYSGETGDYRISCSIGIIMIENNRESFENLYRKADAALYKAKQKGKDQFVLYQDDDAADYSIKTVRTNDEELQNLKTYLSIEAQIFELLYTSKDFNASINMALAAIGQQYHVSRVSIFENSEDNLTTSNIYEWCNTGISPKISLLQNVKISSEADSIFDCFDNNGLLYCNDVGDLPPYFKQLLELKGVISTLKVTISNDEKTCGFIGFDECNIHRIWKAEEIEKLSFLSKVMSVFLFKKKAEITLLENLHTRLKILDILPDYICVVNPETHSLEYSNKKMRELLPTAKVGSFCFTSLRGNQDGPCEICLVEKIKNGDTDNLEIVSENRKLRLKVSALSINWTKSQKMVLLYGSEKAIEIL